MLPYDDEFLDEADDLRQPINYTRISVIIFAVIMIIALLGGAILQAWSAVPALLGYWRSDYRLTITEITPGTCNQSNRSVVPLLCVCGLVDAGDSDADVDFQVRSSDEGELLGKLSLRGQSSGVFCHNMQLESYFVPGQYFLTARPRLSRDIIGRWAFPIPDNSQNV